MTTLGLVIPTYNSDEDLFRACLASVASQSQPPSQTVVVDDGSCPRLVERLKQLAERSGARELRFIALPHHIGMAGARNEGLRAIECDWTLLLDSDDRLSPTACARIRQAADPKAHLLYADHVMIEPDGTRLITRHKAAYHRALLEYGASRMSPFVHATFVFHPQVYRTATALRLGGFGEHWGYGDEIEMQLRIESEIGPYGIFHLPVVLYQYVANPKSVVHQPELYALLIANIERMLLDEMRRRVPFEVRSCRRAGRSLDHHAAHYVFDGDGPLEPAWFDNERLRFT